MLRDTPHITKVSFYLTIQQLFNATQYLKKSLRSEL